MKAQITHFIFLMYALHSNGMEQKAINPIDFTNLLPEEIIQLIMLGGFK